MTLYFKILGEGLANLSAIEPYCILLKYSIKFVIFLNKELTFPSFHVTKRHVARVSKALFDRRQKILKNPFVGIFSMNDADVSEARFILWQGKLVLLLLVAGYNTIMNLS